MTTLTLRPGRAADAEAIAALAANFQPELTDSPDGSDYGRTPNPNASSEKLTKASTVLVMMMRAMRPLSAP